MKSQQSLYSSLVKPNQVLLKICRYLKDLKFSERFEILQVVSQLVCQAF